MRPKLLLFTLLLFFILTPAILAAPPTQSDGQDYIIQSDDWLSKLADKFYGDVLAYPAIMTATNTKAAQDDSYLAITNPDVIEVGQKLFIPSPAEATALLADQSTSANPVADTQVSSNGFSVTVESCGEAVSYSAAPQRALAFDVNLIEMMMQLDLANRMVGYWTSGSEIRPEFQAALASVNEIEAEWPGPSLEVIVGTEADFVLGGWGYGFSEDNGVTPERLKQMGLNSYAIRESCPADEANRVLTIEDTYADIQNVGSIFGHADQAEVLVDQMRSEVSEVTQTIGDTAIAPRVFLYDDIGEGNPYTAGDYGLASNLINLAGGENIYSDVTEVWTTVSWETLIARDPDIIVVIDMDWESAEERIARLKAMPELADMTAIQNERFVVIHYRQIMPGLRNAEAVRVLAEGFYPEKFQ